MEAMEAILTRRSIRRYTSQPVPDELVTDLLKAAMSAPSAHNQQPWHFIVITDKALMDSFRRFHPYASMLAQAPLAVLVCGETEASSEPFNSFWVQDCSAAMENLLIAANGLGLGAVWMGIFPRDNLVKSAQKLFKLPENIMPLGMASIGYPAEQKPPADRYNPARVHKNGW